MTKLQEIRKRIAETIRQSGMTQSEIANKLGITQSTVAHYVMGDITPSLDTFANFCEILDADPSYILGLTD